MLNVDEELDVEIFIGFIDKEKGVPISTQKQVPLEVEVVIPKPLFTVARSFPAIYNPYAIPLNYEQNTPGKAKVVEADVSQRVTRSRRVYTSKNLTQGCSSKGKHLILEMEENGIQKKVQGKEYSVMDQLNKTPTQISILILLVNFEHHKKL